MKPFNSLHKPLHKPLHDSRHTHLQAPLVVAISTALLFGCASDKDKLAQQVIEPELLQPKAEERGQLADQSSPSSAVQTQTEQRHLRLQTRKDQDAVESALDMIGRPTQQPDSTTAHKELKKSRESIAATSGYANKQRQHGTMPSVTVAPPELYYSEPSVDREKFARFEDNGAKQVSSNPLSTFGLDVDTASYALARRNLNQGVLPHPESVRVEEWLNYHSYNYPQPVTREQPFSIYTEIAPSPWTQGNHLLQIGLKGYQVEKSELPPSHLTFLIDVSGSMASADKLPLLKQSLKMLTQQLRPQDRVSIVVYAGAAGVVMEAVPGDHSQQIINALERLRAGGSTAGGAGIQLAYKIAQQHFIEGGINRVLVSTDNDWNVGTTSTEALKSMVEQQRKSGVSLSVLTFGRDNIRDELANALAEIGNGNAAYIDTAMEARKALVDEMSGTLMTIAKDVKFQVEFNPQQVSQYRLIGYETRHLEAQDFKDDRKDAGEMGAGHEVTALYEISLKDSEAVLAPTLRYQLQPTQQIKDSDSGEVAYLKLRYKQPQGQHSTLVSQPIYRGEIRTDLSQASNDFRWAAAVAGAAQIARGKGAAGQWRYTDSLTLGRGALGADPQGYRAEFLRMLSMADTLDRSRQPLATGYGME